MPLYFFRLSTDPDDDDPEQDGVELADFTTACREGVRMCGSIISERDDLSPDNPFSLELSDDDGRRLARVLVTIEFLRE